MRRRGCTPLVFIAAAAPAAPLKPELAGYISCPRCASALKAKPSATKNGEILSGSLTCSRGHRFRITGGIPRLVSGMSGTAVKTGRSFSSKWSRYYKTYHTKEWAAMQADWLIRRFGWKSRAGLDRFLRTRGTILDAGTGAGNSAKLLSSNPRSQVFAMDVSSSVDFAYKKFGGEPNIHFIQASIESPPFGGGGLFDFILSDQVLHHTRDTRKSAARLARLLAPGGQFSMYVYKVKAPIREMGDDYIRARTTKMTEGQCAAFSKEMAELGRSLSAIRQKVRIPRDIPVLGIKKGSYDVQRLVYWNFLKCWWSGSVPFEQSVATNFDWYFPEHAFRHTPREVRSWFRSMGLRITHFDEIESGISVSGKRPARRVKARVSKRAAAGRKQQVLH
ncbi:SAM dependent methyltransferase [Cenarchaeum symbiosum A]|uniref:SAM dependent methyltransferase n=1 Tax=Cenarchaeum symbiosum (strain A) TaxID=414004 RepID=A0RWC0_CENSY|nr:SAM dependent methyltransferase [Cenarchaeum symbiosum A]